MASPSSVLVTGSDRGLGLGFIRHFLAIPEVKHVFATSLDSATAEELKAIGDARLHILKLDVTVDETIIAAEKEVAAVVGEAGLALLINNAGIGANYDLDAKPDRKSVTTMFEINTIGPIIVSQVFLPLLRKAAAASSSLPVSIARAAIVNISSGVGSIEDNRSGGFIHYRASKTALNSITKTVALHVAKDHVLVVAIYPGTVQTAMSAGRGEHTVEESVVLTTKALATFGEKDNGLFFSKAGTPFPY